MADVRGAPPDRLRKRSEFVAAARAAAVRMPGFVLQARRRPDAAGVVRCGFTCSRKVGNAVARNRAKRRLRAVAREVLPSSARPGWDYVLIGRATATASLTYTTLVADLRRALGRVHG